jgi:hypothetical protein
LTPLGKEQVLVLNQLAEPGEMGQHSRGPGPGLVLLSQAVPLEELEALA